MSKLTRRKAPEEYGDISDFDSEKHKKSHYFSKLRLSIWHYTTLLLLVFFASIFWYTRPDRIILHRVLRSLSFSRQCIPNDNFVGSENATRIAILMTYDREHYARLGDLSKQDKLNYAKRYNYTLFVNIDNLDASRKPSWHKILWTRKHIQDFDWVWYVDTDTIIMNHDLSLTRFIDDRFDMILTADHKGLNAGTWFLKNSEWSINFLEKWYSMESFAVSPDERMFGRSGDQDALQYILQKSPNAAQHMKHVKMLSQCAFNSYPHWRGKWDGIYMQGDFLLHMAGKSGDLDRREQMFVSFQKGDLWKIWE